MSSQLIVPPSQNSSTPATVSFFASPIKGGTLGATTYTWPLPSTTTGRLRFSGVGNGAGGGSGSIGSNIIRGGGGGGGGGAVLPVREITVADLQSRSTGTITALYVDFGLPGTGAAANSGTSVAGTNGTSATSITIRANDANGSILLTIPGGSYGYAGTLNGATSFGGASGSQSLNGGAAPFSSGAQASDAGPNLLGPTGGGAGGGLTAANAEARGSGGGKSAENPFASQAASTSGAAGQAGNTSANPFYGSSVVPGLGGGGGASSASTTVPGGKGGDGTGYGAGGGGGGAGTNGSSSGAGGNGSYGCAQADWLPY